MAKRRPNDRDGDDEALGSSGASGALGDRPKLTRRDTWHLVWQTYKTSFPYMLVFVITMLAATWFVTTVIFR